MIRSERAAAPGLPRRPVPNRLARALAFWPETLFLLGTAAAGLWAGGRWLDPFGDPGFSWSLVYRVSGGERLYRDVFVGYTPLSIDLLAPIERAAGFSARSWLLVNWAPAILAGLLLLLAARRLLGCFERLAVAALLMGLSIFAAGSGRLVYPYYPGVVHALLLGVAATLLIPAEGDGTARRGLMAGVLCGLAFGCKQEVGLAALAAVSAPILLRPRGSRRWALGIAGGAVIVGVLLVLRVAAAAPIGTLRDLDSLWPLRRGLPAELSVLYRSAAGIEEPGWMAGVRSSAWWLLWYAGLIFAGALLWKRVLGLRAWAPLAALMAGLGAWRLLEGPAFSSVPRFVLLSSLVSFAVAAIALLRPRVPGRAFLLGFGIFATLTSLRSAFSPFTGGTYDGPGRFAACLAWVLLLCVLLPELFVADRAARALASRCVCVGILAVASGPLVEGMRDLRSASKVAVATRRGVVFASPAAASVLALVSRELTPGERVLLLPESNAIDVLLGVKNPSPLVDVLPGWLNPPVEDEFLARLDRERPDAVVLFRRPMPEFGSAELGRTYGVRLAEWCSRGYETVGESEGGRVLRRSANSRPE